MRVVALLVVFAVGLAVACRPHPWSPVDWCAPEDQACTTCRDGSRCPGGSMQCSGMGGCEPASPPIADVPARRARDAGR